MTILTDDHVQAFATAEGNRDRARNMSMVTLEVTNPKCNNLAVGANIVPRGTHQVTVYQDEADHVFANLLETRLDDVAAAKRQYEMHIAAEAGKLLGYSGSLADLCAEREKGKNPDIESAFKRAEATTGSSVEAVFHNNTKTDMRPLSSAKVVAQGIPEPQREKLVAERTAQTEVMAEAFAKAFAQVQLGMQDQISAAVAKALAAQKQGGNQR